MTEKVCKTCRYWNTGGYCTKIRFASTAELPPDGEAEISVIWPHIERMIQEEDHENGVRVWTAPDFGCKLWAEKAIEQYPKGTEDLWQATYDPICVVKVSGTAVEAMEEAQHLAVMSNTRLVQLERRF